MIDRYHPRQIEKATRQFLGDPLEVGLEEDTRARARAVWDNKRQPIPDLGSLPLASDILREYGADAVRMAYLTCPRTFPDETLLESCFCRLGRFQLAAAREVGRFDEGLWLKTAGAMGDHLLRRGRTYPALAGLCAAWKQSPPGIDTSEAGKRLVISLLEPFAPHLSAWLADTFKVCPGSPRELAEAFPPWRAVRIGLERGGWQWEVFPREEFSRAPLACLRSLTWIQRGFSQVPLSLREELDGWKICILRPDRTNGSLSPS